MINKKSFFILIILVMLLNLAVICANNTDDTISKEKLSDKSPQIPENNYEKDYAKTTGKENKLNNENKTDTKTEIIKQDQKNVKTAAGEENVNSYAGLVTAVNNAKTYSQQNYTINLQSGNYDATEAIRWNPAGTCKTIIINGNNNILNGKGSIQFMQINSGTTVILNNLRLNNYYRNGNGGVIINQGTLIIKNTSLTNNKATMAGGAIYNSEANLILENSTLTNNNATMGGGAIYNYKGNINITGTKITESNVNDPTNGGGAIYNRGTIIINNSSFTKNKIGNNDNSIGGAIYNYQNSLINITNTNFTNNEANEGGAIYTDNSVILNINNSTFKENKAITGGALYCSIKTKLTVTNSNLSNNEVNINDDYGSGGAIYAYSQTVMNLINTILSNNQAKKGGAIYGQISSNITIQNSNITNNTATSQGGGIFSTSYTNLSISNINLINNKAISGGAIYGQVSSTVTIQHSNITNNNASENGGAIYNNNGNLSIFNSALNSNKAVDNGGAIYNYRTSNDNIKFIVTSSNFTENHAGSGAAICSENKGITNTITGNTFTRNTANNNETLVINGNKTINNNIYDSTDISFKTIKLSLEDEKTTYGPDEDVILNFTIELEHPEYYDLNILETINKTIYINNIENETTTVTSYTLSSLEIGKYDAYYTSFNQKSNNVTFWVADDFVTNVSNYKLLVEAIKNATSNLYYTYKINLLPGDYNATENITWSNSDTQKIIINGNGNLLDGQSTYQFIEIAQGHNLTLENITLTNYTGRDGGVINNKGNLSIYNTTLHNNKAIRGGAIYNWYGNINIIESNLAHNNATNSGGAIYNYGNINITQSNLTYNTATYYGGALYSSNGNMQILNSSLNNNKAEQSTGGAIYIIDSTVIITNSSLENNTSPEHGGAIYNYEGYLSMFNSAFNNNKADGNGGAIYNYRRSNNFEFNVADSNFTENQASSGAAICSETEGITNTITGNTFTRNTANNNETLVINGNKTINNNIYDSTDINIKTLNLTFEDEKTTYDPDEEVILYFTIELEHPEYYDSDILEKVDINKTIYINNIENKTTTISNYTLSNLEIGTYNVYFTSSNLKSNNETFRVSIYEVNVSNYQQLVEAINNATNEEYKSYKINLLAGDYNATQNIKWENSVTRKIIINGNGNTLNGQGTYQFIQIAKEHDLTLENITLTNYTAQNGGAINNEGNLTITNSTLNNNKATQEGGAIYNRGNLTITNSTLNNNKAKERGGAVRNYEGNLNITDTNLNNNTALDGGAIGSYEGKVIITSTNLNNNKAETSAGGAIYISDSNVIITNSTLENNTSPTHGGGIYNTAGNINLINSSLNNNKAGWNGGAIFNYGRNKDIIVNVTNSNFTENQASSGAAIYSDNEGITNTITGNTFTRNSANNNETLVINGNKIISNNIYDSTDISFKTIKLSLEDEKTIYNTSEDVILNFMIELEHPEYYDSDLLEKMGTKTLYINNIENDTTTNHSYLLSNLERGKYNIYYITCNLQSNHVIFQVLSDSTISTPEESYEYYAGANNKIPLSINNPCEEKGIITAIVNDENGHKILSSYYNIGDSYELQVETLIDGLKNIYTTLDDSYSITVTYTSNNDYVSPSSTNFTLNIIKQRNTTIVYNILNNTEGNVQINITVLDAVYNTPIQDAPIQVTGDITKNTTAGIITDITLTPGDYMIIVNFNENSTYCASNNTIDFNVEIDKDKKIKELEEDLKDANNKITELNNNITQANTKIKEQNKTIEELNKQIANQEKTITNLTAQKKELNNNITELQQELKEAKDTITNQNKTINELNNKIADANRNINNLNKQLNDATNKINNLTSTVNDLTNKNKELEEIIKELNKTTSKLNTTITIKPVKAMVGEITTLSVSLKDQNNQAITEGKVVFKVNGITLKDENKNTLYADVKDGIASINYKVQSAWMKNTTYIEAVYSGTEKYTTSRSKQTDIVNTSKGKATITLDKKSITTKAGQTITLRAKILDSNGDRVNNDKVVFKLNGKTLKDSKGNTLYAKVIDGESVLNYTIPATYSAKTYTLTCVFGGNYYQRTETNGTIKLEKKAVLITPDSVTTKNKKTSVKATITDETGKLLVTSTKLAVKIKGKTILNNVTSKNGKIDLSFTTTLRPGLYELLLISGENGVYKTGKVTTVLKI